MLHRRDRCIREETRQYFVLSETHHCWCVSDLSERSKHSAGAVYLVVGQVQLRQTEFESQRRSFHLSSRLTTKTKIVFGNVEEVGIYFDSPASLRKVKVSGVPQARQSLYSAASLWRSLQH